MRTRSGMGLAPLCAFIVALLQSCTAADLGGTPGVTEDANATTVSPDGIAREFDIDALVATACAYLSDAETAPSIDLEAFTQRGMEESALDLPEDVSDRANAIREQLASGALSEPQEYVSASRELARLHPTFFVASHDFAESRFLYDESSYAAEQMLDHHPESASGLPISDEGLGCRTLVSIGLGFGSTTARAIPRRMLASSDPWEVQEALVALATADVRLTVPETNVPAYERRRWGEEFYAALASVDPEAFARVLDQIARNLGDGTDVDLASTGSVGIALTQALDAERVTASPSTTRKLLGMICSFRYDEVDSFTGVYHDAILANFDARRRERLVEILEEIDDPDSCPASDALVPFWAIADPARARERLEHILLRGKRRSTERMSDGEYRLIVDKAIERLDSIAVQTALVDSAARTDEDTALRIMKVLAGSEFLRDEEKLEVVERVLPSLPDALVLSLFQQYPEPDGPRRSVLEVLAPRVHGYITGRGWLDGEVEIAYALADASVTLAEIGWPLTLSEVEALRSFRRQDVHAELAEYLSDDALDRGVDVYLWGAPLLAAGDLAEARALIANPERVRFYRHRLKGGAARLLPDEYTVTASSHIVEQLSQADEPSATMAGLEAARTIMLRTSVRLTMPALDAIARADSGELDSYFLDDARDPLSGSEFVHLNRLGYLEPGSIESAQAACSSPDALRAFLTDDDGAEDPLAAALERVLSVQFTCPAKRDYADALALSFERVLSGLNGFPDGDDFRWLLRQTAYSLRSKARLLSPAVAERLDRAIADLIVSTRTRYDASRELPWRLRGLRGSLSRYCGRRVRQVDVPIEQDSAADYLDYLDCIDPEGVMLFADRLVELGVQDEIELHRIVRRVWNHVPASEDDALARRIAARASPLRVQKEVAHVLAILAYRSSGRSDAEGAKVRRFERIATDGSSSSILRLAAGWAFAESSLAASEPERALRVLKLLEREVHPPLQGCLARSATFGHQECSVRFGGGYTDSFFDARHGIPGRSHTAALRALALLQSGATEQARSALDEAYARLTREESLTLAFADPSGASQLHLRSTLRLIQSWLEIRDARNLPAAAARLRRAFDSLRGSPYSPHRITLERLALSAQLSLESDFASFATGESAGLLDATSGISVAVRNDFFIGTKAERSVLSDTRTMREGVAALEAELEDVTREEGASSMPAREARRRFQVAKSDYRRHVVRISKSFPSIAAFLEPTRAMDASLIWERLAPDELLIAYTVTEHGAWASVFTRGAQDVIALPTSGREIGQLVRRYRSFVANPRFDELGMEALEVEQKEAELAARISRLLLTPIEGHIAGATALVLVPDGPLHQLPFAALTLSGRRLIAHVSIARLPSLSAGLLERPSPRMERALIIGDPVLDREAWSPLPAAATEAREVASRLRDAQVFLGKQATRDLLVGQDLTHSLLHIASHAKAGAAADTFIAMSDGELELRDVWRLTLSGSPVVVLSACETGLGERIGRNEVASLSAGFLYAGTDAVVASLWEVDDFATLQLMRRFYDGLVEEGPSSALRSAQLALIAAREPADRWAPFVVSRSGL